MESASITSSMSPDPLASKAQETQKAVVTKLVNSAPLIAQSQAQAQSAAPRLDFMEDSNTGKNIQAKA